MKGKFFLILIAVATLAGGGQGLYTLLTNRSPMELTAYAYIQDKPSAKWLKLKQCVVDLTACTYSSFLGVGKIKEVYVPVGPANGGSYSRIHILLATKDPQILELAGKIRGMNSESEMKAFVAAHRNELLVRRDVEGLVRFGMELKEDDERALRRENPNLAENFVVIDEGARPAYDNTLILLSVGVVVSGLLLRDMIRKPKDAASVPPLLSQPDREPPVLPPNLPPRLP